MGTVVCLRWRVTLTEFPHWRAASALSTLRLAVKSPQSPAPFGSARTAAQGRKSSAHLCVDDFATVRGADVRQEHAQFTRCGIRATHGALYPSNWRRRLASAMADASTVSAAVSRELVGLQWARRRWRNRRGGVGRRRASGVRCALRRVLMAIRHGTLVVSCIPRGPRQRSNNLTNHFRTRIGRLTEATTTKTIPSRRAAVLPWPGHLRLRLRIALAKFFDAAACAAAARSYSSTSPACCAETSALCTRRTSSSNCGTSMGPPSKFVAP